MAVDRTERSVTASLFSLPEARAVATSELDFEEGGPKTHSGRRHCAGLRRHNHSLSLFSAASVSAVVKKLDGQFARFAHRGERPPE
jgi:hypothetical protein